MQSGKDESCKPHVPFCCFQCLYMVFIIAFSICCLVLPIDVYYSLQTVEGNYNSVLTNWNTPPIMNLTQVLPEQSCPPGSEESLINYYYTGTNEGCNCTHGGIDNAKCCSGPFCVQSTCEGDQIKPTPPNNLTNWETEGRVWKICVTRLVSNFNYFNSSTVISCPQFYKACGQGNGMICIPTSYQFCPITYIAITNSTANPYYRIPISKNYYLEYATYENRSGPFISEFTVVQGEGVCLDPQYVSDTKPQYMLSNQSRYNCKFDPRWIKTGQITQYGLFKVNNMLPEIEHLPDFNLSDTIAYTFYQRSYLELSRNCPPTIKQEFLSNSQRLVRIQNTASTLIYFGMALVIFNVFIEALFSKQHRNLKHYGLTVFDREGVEKDCNVIYKYIALGVKIIVHFGFGITLFVLMGQFGRERSFTSDVYEKNCVDTTTQAILQTVDNAMDSGFTWSIFGMWIFSIFIEPNVSWILRKHILKRDFSLGEEPNQQDRSPLKNNQAQSLQTNQNIYTPPQNDPEKHEFGDLTSSNNV